MSILLAEFTTEGNRKYKDLFASKETKFVLEKAEELSQDPDLIIESDGLEIEAPRTRIQVGQELYPLIGPTGPASSYATKEEFWNWLSARLLKSSLVGSLQLGEQARYVLQTGVARREYRHLLESSYLTYSSHINDLQSAMVVLCQDLSTPGEAVSVLLATRGLVASKNVMKVATKLYFDPDKEAIKSGVSGQGPGSIRRFPKFLNQLENTVDYKSMTSDEILDLLPAEFDRFKS